jgi:NAD+ synthase (glutamine-hydrolysing)
MDGDTAGSLAPIAGVSKHFIRQWLVWARDHLQYPVLDLIIAQQPTAELRPSEQKQTDEADLMPYDLLEQIEVCWIGNRMSREETIARLKETRSEKGEYLESQVDRFIALWKRSQWKRERLAPSFHLDRFNIDPKSTGRFPILSK